MPPKQKKKLSFADEVHDKVETVHIGKEMKKQAGPAKGNLVAKAAAARGAKKGGAPAVKKGIITSQHAKAQEAKHRKKKTVAPDDDEEDEEEGPVSDSEADDGESSSDDSSNHSAEGADDGDAANPFVRAKRGGGKLAYPVLRLRFLPLEFQEPQLYKFLNQFGGTVLNCFCVRSKRTHQSKGIAYVQFDTPDVLPIVLEECHGMALGGRALKASVVTMHRPMPPKEVVARRRAVAYAYATKGKPLQQYDVSTKDPVALLVKAAQSEKENNAHLQRLGIAFASNCFATQLQAVPAALRKRPRTEGAEGTKAPAAPAAARTPPRATKEGSAPATTPSPKVEAGASPRSSAKKGSPPRAGSAPSPKEGGASDSIVLDAVSPSPAKGRASQGEKKKSASRSPSTKSKK